jgi:hypothetical protein
LGKVLVTIDDLQALITHLGKSEPNAIPVEFDGGYLTDAQELPTLSDAEMRSLRLKNSEVQVVLSPSEAFAVGDFLKAEEVHRIWSRARQTRLKPPSSRLLNSDSLGYIVGTLTFAFSLANLATVGTALYKNSPLHDYSSSIMLSVIGITMSVLVFRFALRSTSSYAVVVPLSLADHRQKVSAEKNPRRNLVVNVILAVITAISVGVAIWTTVTSKKP